MSGGYKGGTELRGAGPSVCLREDKVQTQQPGHTGWGGAGHTPCHLFHPVQPDSSGAK